MVAADTGGGDDLPVILRVLGTSFQQRHPGHGEGRAHPIQQRRQGRFAPQHAAGGGGQDDRLSGQPGGLPGPAGRQVDDGAHGGAHGEEDHERQHVVGLGDGEGVQRRHEEVVEQQAARDGGRQRRVDAADEGDGHDREQVQQDLAGQGQHGPEPDQREGEHRQGDDRHDGAGEAARRRQPAAQRRQYRASTRGGVLMADHVHIDVAGESGHGGADARTGEERRQPAAATGAEAELGGVLRPGVVQQRDRHAVADHRVVAAAEGFDEDPLPGQRLRVGPGQTVRAGDVHGEQVTAVHVTSSDGLAGTDPQALARQRVLVESLGGSYHTVVGDSVPVALLDYARAENATQLVLGASRRGRLATFLTGPGIGAAVTRLSGDIDVHMVSHERAASGGGLVLPSLGGGLTPARRLAGAVMAVVALPVLTLALVGLRPALTLPSQILLYLLTVVAVAFVGGVYPALAAAVAGSLLLNYFFVPPLHTFTIAEPNNVLALVVFLTVGAAVSSVVDLAARRTRQAARLSREAVILSTAAGRAVSPRSTLPALLDRVRSTFAMSGVTLLERRAEHPEDHWEVVASAGVGCHHPDDADVVVAAGEGLALVLRGRLLRAEDERVLTVFAVQAAAKH